MDMRVSMRKVGTLEGLGGLEFDVIRFEARCFDLYKLDLKATKDGDVANVF